MEHVSSPGASVVVLVGLGVFAGVVAWTSFRASRGRGEPSTPTTVIVQCRAGHLFTTVWLPFVTFKAIRIGLVRIQRCPVGDHISAVIRVDPASLTETERRFAAHHPDSLVP
jgi:hypothetical protein